MAKWDEKYFVTGLVQTNMVEAPWNPSFTDKEGTRLLALDDKIRKGAFYMELAWFWPGKWPATKGEEGVIKAHKHDFDETVAFVGTDPKDPYALNGEIEFWVDGKKNVLDRSFVAFLPAGTVHGPIFWLKLDKPVFHFTSGMGRDYNPKKQ
jgi:hypothetical protein